MGSGTSKARKVDVNADRKEELRVWRSKAGFMYLPPDGLEEFSRFLSPDDQRRLKFYENNPSFDAAVLSPYISEGPDMLKDVSEDSEYREEIMSKAKDVAEYVSKLKRTMKPDLDIKFSEFQRKLDTEMAAISGS